MRTLIWDFDGTLGYREGGTFSAALAETARRESPDSGVTADQLRPHLQSGFPWHTPNRPHLDITSAAQWWDALRPVLERAFREVGFDETQACSLARQVRGVYSDPARWRLFDDVIPTLVRLSSQGWTHVLLSNHVPELSEIVHHLKLGPHLTGIFNSAETGYEKPHPQAFLNVLEAIGSPTAVWMIGDSYAADVSGAEAVGIPAILIRRTHVEARYTCNQLAQVPMIVDG
jgi:putative hydrolase of the HAD superfamily